MAQMFAKVANWLANEVIVKTLSENKAFQQFALKTAKKGGQVVNSVKGKAEGAKLSDKATGSVENAQAGLKGVFDWVASDLSKVGSKRK